MAEMFSEDWTVEVYGHSLDTHVPFSVGFVPHRFVIEGSRASDGGYEIDKIAGPVSVSGPKWFVRFEFLYKLNDWRPNPVSPQRIAAYTIQGGLVVFLVAPNNLDGTSDLGASLPFKDIVLRCHNLDPKLKPMPHFRNPYDFALPPHKRPTKPD